MSKGQRQRVKYMLLAVIGIIKLYLRAANVSELSAKKSGTLECSKEEKTGLVFNNAQLKAGEQGIAEQDAKKTVTSPLCSISNTKSAAAHTENANPNKQKELCTLEGMVDTKSIAEKKESSASALGVPESRHLGRSNSTSQLAKYAMDKKNSSNLVVEKKEEGMAKEEVEAAIEKYAVEMKRLTELKDTVKLAKDAFEEKSNKVVDAKKIYNKHIAIYNAKIKEVDNITRRINAYYGDPSDLEPADNMPSEKNKRINMICTLNSEIKALDKEKKKISTSHQETIGFMKEMEKSTHISRKISMEYQSLAVKAEKKLLALIKSISERFKKTRERDGLLHLNAESEKDYLERAWGILKLLISKFGLYEKRMHLMAEAIDSIASMQELQENVISRAVEREQAYISYDAAESAYKKQRHVVDTANKAMRAAEED
ncbi:hypothetical protein NEAUS05_1683 [Nematocida ausubeli]|nr:hypothetical protein NEAUS07_1736 [Nematocida ausubeli]KAI5149214.1 hypothetical protein NEAUS05_1683 [Nematocida ausubeli]